jgi:hypothetical protein
MKAFHHRDTEDTEKGLMIFKESLRGRFLETVSRASAFMLRQTFSGGDQGACACGAGENTTGSDGIPPPQAASRFSRAGLSPAIEKNWAVLCALCDLCGE